MTTAVLIVIGMIFLKIEPFYESLFFVALVTYLLIFLIKLIRDLDNPFGHHDKRSFEDVSLKPIDDAVASLSGRLNAYIIKGKHDNE